MFRVLCILLAFCRLGFSNPIVYGARLTKIEYPFLVFLDITATETNYITNIKYTYEKPCGGTLISLKTILTAAHCLEMSIGPPTASVYAGVLAKKYFGNRGYTRMMQDYDIHPDYTANNIDLALIHVVRPFELVPGSVEVASTTKVRFQDTVTIAGWGVKEFDRNGDVLRKTSMTIIQRNKCRLSYGSTDVMLCFINPLKHSTFCDGDSGGPVIFNNKVVGVISENEAVYGINDNGERVEVCSPKHPSSAVDISKYHQWIYANKK